MTFDVSRSRSREVGHSGLRQTARQGLGRQGDRNQPQPYPHLAYGTIVWLRDWGDYICTVAKMESSPSSSAS